jgi:hypothetical protein
MVVAQKKKLPTRKRKVTQKPPRATFAPGTAARRDLEKALEGVDERYLYCRDPGIRHPWEVVVDFHVITDTQEGSRRLPIVARDSVCSRCGTQKQERFYATKNRGLEKYANHYTYPEDYQLAGVPRGVKPSSVIWQEGYRRSLEKAVGAAKGTRTHERSR